MSKSFERNDNMAKRLLTECPYCHRKVSFIGAGILKTKGEHICKGCKCISNVVIHRLLYGIAGATVISSLIIMLVYSNYGKHNDFRGLLYVMTPFLIFYLLVPFFVKLEPCSDKSAVKKLHRKIDPLPIPDKKNNKKHEQPIELNVGDDFSKSFMKAKTSIKTTEEDQEDKYDRLIDENEKELDITSGIDIDISGTINKTEETEASEDGDDDIKIYNSSIEENKTEIISENKEIEENEDIIPKYEPEKTEIIYDYKDETEDNEAEEVSFIVGKKYDNK